MAVQDPQDAQGAQPDAASSQPLAERVDLEMQTSCQTGRRRRLREAFEVDHCNALNCYETVTK